MKTNVERLKAPYKQTNKPANKQTENLYKKKMLLKAFTYSYTINKSMNFTQVHFYLDVPFKKDV